MTRAANRAGSLAHGSFWNILQLIPMRKISWSILLLVPFWGVPVGIFLWQILQTAADVPFWDDYLSILWSLLQIAKNPNPIEVLQSLFSLHNEHRLTLLRLIALADWWLNGAINFRHLVLAGNLFLVGIFLLMLRAGNVSFPLLWYAPLAPLLFQLRFYDGSLWTTAALSHYPSIFLATAGLLLLVKPSRVHFALSCLLGLIASYTQGNGMLVFVAGLPGLILLKRYRRAAIWLGLFGLIAALYFHGYVKPGNQAWLAAVFEQPGSAMQFFFLFIGAFAIPGETAAPTGWSLVLCALASAALLIAAAACLILRRADQKNLVLCLLALFLLTSSASVMINRIGFGVEYALSSRYAVYSAVLAGVLYLLLLEVSGRSRRFIVGSSLGLAIIVWMASAKLSLPLLDARGVQLRRSVRLGNGCYEHPIFAPVEAAASILRKAEKSRLYYLPLSLKPGQQSCLVADFYETAAGASLPHVTQTGGNVDEIRLEDSTVHASGWIPINRLEREPLLHIAVPSEPAWHGVQIVARPDVARHMGDPTYLESGFSLQLHYMTQNEARIAAADLCMAASSANTPITLLNSKYVFCRRYLATQ